MQKKEIADIEFGSKDQFEDFQLRKLREHVNDLIQRSPYYKKLFRSGIDIRNYGDIANLPCTTKDDLANHNNEFLAVDAHDISDYATTSGTLGSPVSICLTSNDIERLGYNEMRSFQLTGANSTDIFQLLTTIDKRFMAGLAYHYGAKALGAGMIRMGPGAIPLQWESIQRFKPTYLIAVPSFIPKLIEYATDNGIDYKDSSVKKVICIGEPIRDQLLQPNNIAKKIIGDWSVDLHSTYASSEMATAFTECEHGVGGHVLPELIYTEVLDDDGNHVPNGGIGEVVVTPFGIEGMPLLRFKTGDICTYYSEKCTCGRITPRLGPVLGRKQHMLKIKGTSIYPASISNVVNGIPEISNFVIVADHDSSGMDHATLYLTEDESEAKGVLQDQLHATLRVNLDIVVKSKSEINHLKFNEQNRKPQTFIDLRTSK